jgi:hypothetical protein
MFKVSLQNILGDALWQVRKSRRLTQQAVAKLGGVAVPTIRLLERGRGNLPLGGGTGRARRGAGRAQSACG